MADLEWRKSIQALASRSACAILYLLMVGGIMASIISLGSFLGMLTPVADLFSHFRWQYASLLTTLCLIALVWRKKAYATIFGVAALGNALAVASLWLPPSQTVSAQRTPTVLTLLDMNLLVNNLRSDLVGAEIRKYDPDVIVMEELNETMLKQLAPMLKDYPFQSYSVSFDPWGVGIFSKTRLNNAKPNLLNLPHSYISSADINLAGKVVTIIGMHTVPELSISAVATDRMIIDGLHAFQRSCPNTVIMVGDFNATPWSEFFRQLIGTGNLIDSERGFGMQLSWPTGIPILQIPIDHCVYSPNCLATTRQIGDFVGSDHYPVFFRIEVAEPSAVHADTTGNASSGAK